jgi:hypothetical protein
MKKMLKYTLLAAILATLLLFLSAAAPTPTATITVISGLPQVMNVGDTATVVIQVESDQTFNFAEAKADPYYPGKGVVLVKNNTSGTSRVGRGTSATLTLTFEAKGSTANFTNGVAPIGIVAGARYGNGGTIGQRFDFTVQVP